MDLKTIDIYDREAAGFAREWEEDQAPPDDLQAAVLSHFHDGPTVDVGCGSGRDTAWLVSQGFEAVGVDAAARLLTEARRRHPGVRFETDTLPALSTLGSRCYANVLCETVIMHLDHDTIPAAVHRLVDLLVPAGVLYLSWRVTESGDRRDDAGRLYAAFDKHVVSEALAGTDILLDERRVSASSKKIIHRIVARRP